MSGRFAVLVTVAVLAFPGIARAAPTAVFGKCPAGAAANARCGTVAVPLDRSNANSPTLPIAFVFTPHTGGGPAEGGFVMFHWGPGGPHIDADPLWGARGAPPAPLRPSVALHHS